MLINLTALSKSKKATFNVLYRDMKKLYAVAAILLAIVSGAVAQVNDQIAPKSFSISKRVLSPLQEFKLAPLTITEAERLDKIDEKTGELPKFSRSIYTNINLDNAGSWTQLANGDRIWRTAISAPGALGLVPLFNKYYLPKGAALHVYMPGQEEVLGAFTDANNPANGYFCTGLIHGDVAVVEYYEPAAVRGMGYFNINEVGYAYRFVPPLYKSTDEFGTSASCEVNVNCTEGTNYQDQKRAVVRILVQGSGGQGWCSGTLINNVKQDCTPYLLSAQHCSEGTSTNQYSQWVFYFNYEAPGCTNPASEGSLGNKTVIGCTKKADSNDNGGDTGSDFLLLQLNQQPQPSYNAYFAGWNATATAPLLGVCIHHPDADIKKISTFTTPGISDKWGTATGSHWRITWVQTLNGHGVTEGGSSGSAIFNATGQIVGQLTGGGSYCQAPNSPDLFGKFSYDWQSNGTADNRRLKPWLDPNNTGATSLGGLNHPCGNISAYDAGISAIPSPATVSCSTSITPQVRLENYGTNALTSVTITYLVDGSTYTYNWTGNLAALSSTTVNLPQLAISAGEHTLSASTSSPNGNNDGNATNDGAASTFTTVNPNSALNLYLKTDDYGTETTWEISDASSSVVYSGGPYPDTQSGSVYNIPVCLKDGCYTLTIYDSYGDGMNGQNATGDMKLTGPGNTPVYAALTTPNFGYDESFSFCIGQVGINDVDAINIQVYPNPNQGTFNVRFDKTEERTINVYNTMGEVVSQTVSSAQQLELNIGQQSAGIYILQVESPSGKALKKLIVN